MYPRKCEEKALFRLKGMLRHSFSDFLWQSLAVQEQICGIQRHIVARHIPRSLIIAACPPGILHHVVWFPIFVKSLAIDEHNMVVGEAPVVKLFLPFFNIPMQRYIFLPKAFAKQQKKNIYALIRL